VCRVRCVAYPGGGAGGGAEPGEDLVDQQSGGHRKLRVAEHPFPAGPGHQRPHGRAAGGGAGVADAGGGPVAVPVGDRVPQVVGGLRVRRGTQRGVARSVPACQARWNLSEWSDHGKIAVLSRAVVCIRRPGKGRRIHREATAVRLLSVRRTRPHGSVGCLRLPVEVQVDGCGDVVLVGAVRLVQVADRPFPGQFSGVVRSARAVRQRGPWGRRRRFCRSRKVVVVGHDRRRCMVGRPARR